MRHTSCGPALAGRSSSSSLRCSSAESNAELPRGGDACGLAVAVRVWSSTVVALPTVAPLRGVVWVDIGPWSTMFAVSMADGAVDRNAVRGSRGWFRKHAIGRPSLSTTRLMSECESSDLRGVPLPVDVDAPAVSDASAASPLVPDPRPGDSPGTPVVTVCGLHGPTADQPSRTWRRASVAAAKRSSITSATGAAAPSVRRLEVGFAFRWRSASNFDIARSTEVDRFADKGPAPAKMLSVESGYGRRGDERAPSVRLCDIDPSLWIRCSVTESTVLSRPGLMPLTTAIACPYSQLPDASGIEMLFVRSIGSAGPSADPRCLGVAPPPCNRAAAGADVHEAPDERGPSTPRSGRLTTVPV